MLENGGGAGVGEEDAVHCFWGGGHFAVEGDGEVEVGVGDGAVGVDVDVRC